MLHVTFVSDISASRVVYVLSRPLFTSSSEVPLRKRRGRRGAESQEFTTTPSKHSSETDSSDDGPIHKMAPPLPIRQKTMGDSAAGKRDSTEKEMESAETDHIRMEKKAPEDLVHLNSTHLTTLEGCKTSGTMTMCYLDSKLVDGSTCVLGVTRDLHAVPIYIHDIPPRMRNNQVFKVQGDTKLTPNDGVQYISASHIQVVGLLDEPLQFKITVFSSSMSSRTAVVRFVSLTEKGLTETREKGKKMLTVGHFVAAYGQRVAVSFWEEHGDVALGLVPNEAYVLAGMELGRWDSLITTTYNKSAFSVWIEDIDEEEPAVPRWETVRDISMGQYGEITLIGGQSMSLSSSSTRTATRCFDLEKNMIIVSTESPKINEFDKVIVRGRAESDGIPPRMTATYVEKVGEVNNSVDISPTKRRKVDLD